MDQLKLSMLHKAESPNYLFIDLVISPEIKSEYNFEIGFSKGKSGHSYKISNSCYVKILKINLKALINLMLCI